MCFVQAYVLFIVCLGWAYWEFAQDCKPYTFEGDAICTLWSKKNIDLVCNQNSPCYCSFYPLRNHNLWIFFPNHGPQHWRRSCLWTEIRSVLFVKVKVNGWIWNPEFELEVNFMTEFIKKFSTYLILIFVVIEWPIVEVEQRLLHGGESFVGMVLKVRWVLCMKLF